MSTVIGGLASQGLIWLFQQFGDWVFQWIYDAVSKLVDALLGLTTSATSIFWEVPVIEVLLDFSAWVNMATLVVALLFLMMDIAEQSGRVNWTMVFANLCKGLVFVFFNRYIGLATFQIAVQSADALDIRMEAPSSATILAMFSTQTSGIFIILMTLVVLAAFIAFFCMAMIRNGTMFVQILSSSFYIPDIVRGDTAQTGEWFRRTVAISATYFMQYLLFYLGLNALTELSGSALVMTGTCWLTMFMVPKILERFGYSSGAGTVFSAAGSVAGAGLSMVK